MLASHDDLAELAKDRLSLIGHGLVQHVVQFRLVAETHAADADFRQQVVFADFAPAVVVVVVPCAIKGGEI